MKFQSVLDILVCLLAMEKGSVLLHKNVNVKMTVLGNNVKSLLVVEFQRLQVMFVQEEVLVISPQQQEILVIVQQVILEMNDCQFATCSGIIETNNDVCSGRGQCIGLNTCNCSTGYTGN